MVYSLQGDLAYTTIARRDQVFAQIQSAIADDPRWGNDLLIATVIASPRWEGPPQPGHVPVVRFGLRFTTRAAQERVVGQIQDLATGVRLPLDTSWFQIHDCRDDEGEGHGICPVPTKYVWTGGVLVQQ